MNPPRVATYVVGIDLGTSHTVVAYADLRHRGRRPEVFAIPQRVSAATEDARPLLPSVLYAEESTTADATPAWVVGAFARLRSVEVPGRTVTSAKSWLAHAGVDRYAPILPWTTAEHAGTGELVLGAGREGRPPRLVDADAGTPRAPAGPRLSPVDASARILAHVRVAWDAAHPNAPLAEQDVVLTVPASFDEVARTLTMEATRRAGLPSVRLLEEPQAAFLDWCRAVGDHGLRALFDADGSAEGAGAGGEARRVEILVCDVGGGTTDFSLLAVSLDDAALGGVAVTRVAVGEHLLLGGDNMDVALAHFLEPKLSAGQGALSPGAFAQLTLATRGAKETLLRAEPSAENVPREATVTLLGAGSRLVGGARKATLHAREVEEVVVEGFFPMVSRESTLARARPRAGLVAFGLPYASDPAITRHLAAFLARHSRWAHGGDPPGDTVDVRRAVLLNGGVFHAPRLSARLLDAVAALSGPAEAPPALLPHADPDLAVARGAVEHGLALRGLGRKIGGGSPRGYFIGIAPEGPPHRAIARLPGDRCIRRAVCVVPKGAEPGERLHAKGKTFALTVGRAARFDLFASTGGATHGSQEAQDAQVRDTAVSPGDVVDIDEVDDIGEIGGSGDLDEARFLALPPLVTAIGVDSTRVSGASGRGEEVRVELEGELTEVGTLDLSLVEVGVPADRARRFRLGFELRRDLADAPPPSRSSKPATSAEAGAASSTIASPSPERRAVRPERVLGDRHLDDARAQIERVFGKARGDVDVRAAKSLTRDLEKVLGDRATWPTAIVRPLFDALHAGVPARKRSPDHERVWWSLAGYMLRPGFGDPLDHERVAAVAPLWQQGVAFPKEGTTWRAWWVAWRRIAGGLLEDAQVAIRDTLDPFLAPPAPPRKKPKNIRPEPLDELLLLASSLERLPPLRRTELGAWILERTWTSNDPALYAALGRIGARAPAYASVHHVVSPRIAETWLSHVLRADWRVSPTAPFAAVQLARKTGDRARDISDARRHEVVERLVRAEASPAWIEAVKEVVAVGEAQRREMFGESLPIGLRLIEG